MSLPPARNPPPHGFGTYGFGAFNAARIALTVPLEVAWPVLFDRAAWIPGFAGKALVDGPEGGVGERALYSSRDAAGQVHTRLEEILELVPQCRLVLRLALADDSATTAFADWRLFPATEGCTLELNLFWLDLPETGTDWPAVQAQRATYIAATQAVIDGHLMRLREVLARR